jgi:hypothetical protein
MKNKPLFLLVSFLFFALDSYAVFIASGTPNGNTSAPVGDRGWSSMGIYNGASAVYLGNGWFITARHMGSVSTVKFNEVNYSINSSSRTSITNANGSYADIQLFQVVDPAAISASGSRVNAGALGAGTSLTMIGYGRNVSSIVTNKYNSQGIQTQVRYYEGTTSQMKWGGNTISGFSNSFESVGFGFFSDVLQTTLSSGKAQALDKDSGGGVFLYDNVSGDYLLAGIMIGAVRYQDANGIFAVTDTGNPSINSKTYSVNLSAYSSQINQAIPEPTTGILLVGVGIVFGAIKRLRYMYQ